MTWQNTFQMIEVPQEIRDGHYDLMLHSCSVASCLGREAGLVGLSDLYYELHDGTPDDYSEAAFRNPLSLEKALVSTYLTNLINGDWPNAISGYRKIPVCWDEVQLWEDEQVFDQDDDQPLINSDAHLQEPWLFAPALHWIDDRFVFKALELLTNELKDEEVSEWPLVLLLGCPQFLTGWRLWTTNHMFHPSESDDPNVIDFKNKMRGLVTDTLEQQNATARALSRPEIPEYTCDEMERLYKKALVTSKPRQREISIHLEHCREASDRFKEGERIQGFSELRSALDFRTTEWCMAYLDYQVTQSLLQRSDLDLHEWLEVLASSIEAIRHGYRSDNQDESKLLAAESSAGILTTVIFDEYWAWRLGYVVAAGSHLYKELYDAATLVSRPGADLLDLMSSTFVGTALDLMLSLGDNQDWDDLSLQFGGLYKAYKRDNFAEYSDRLEYWDTDEIIDIKSPLLWLIKLGYVSYKRRRGQTHDELRNDNNELSIGRLERQWDESSIQQIAQGLENPLKDLIGGLLGQLIPQAVETHISPIKEINNTENVIKQVGQSIFEQLPSPVINHLSKAEEYFDSKNLKENAYLVSQHYANATEGILRYRLLPKIKVLYERHRLVGNERPSDPRFLGEWEFCLNNLLRIANADVFDYSDFWPEFDQAAILQLVEPVRSINTGRGLSHEGVPLEMPDESREKFLGTLAGSQSKGVLELVALLSGMEI